MNTYTIKASIEAAETQDAFIFKFISPFINDVAGFEISKKELVEAVTYIRLKKEAAEKYGIDIGCELNRATEMSRELGKAYDRGFEDGVRRERDRMMCMLTNDLED